MASSFRGVAHHPDHPAKKMEGTIRPHHLAPSGGSEDVAELEVPPPQIYNWVNQAKPQIEKLFERPAARPSSQASNSQCRQIALFQAKLMQNFRPSSCRNTK
jgi:hypothetical protein